MADELPDAAGETPRHLVYDDDPIEAVLYEASPQSPTPASIFEPARTLMQEITSGNDTLDSDAILCKCSQFFAEEAPLPPALYADLCDFVILPALRTLPETDARQEALGTILGLCVARELKGELQPILCRALGR